MKTPSILSLICLLMFTSASYAQPGGGNRPKKEKVEELKIAFLTSELDLSAEEAQKFWPVYNELSEKLQAENRKQRQMRRDLMQNSANYTDADFKAKSEAMLDSGVREAQLRKDYHAKIAAAIGYKKATKLLSLEERFKKELLNRLNGQEGGQGRPEDPQN